MSVPTFTVSYQGLNGRRISCTITLLRILVVRAESCNGQFIFCRGIQRSFIRTKTTHIERTYMWYNTLAQQLIASIFFVLNTHIKSA